VQFLGGLRKAVQPRCRLEGPQRAQGRQMTVHTDELFSIGTEKVSFAG
jgi:hypothetical protein